MQMDLREREHPHLASVIEPSGGGGGIGGG